MLMRRRFPVTALAAACSILAGVPAWGAHPQLSREDAQWLARITYGPTTETVDEYLKLGRRRYLAEQLHPHDIRLPPEVAHPIAALEISRTDAASLLAQARSEHQRINALSDETQKQEARKALNERGRDLAYQAARREILLALYSPAQLQEQMTWFWLNHFSVFQHKAHTAFLVGDFADHAIRPRALGHFRDLVLATLTHPAMLLYLDNAQNAVGHVNENYARELMELHTLGVNSGYTQQDIQELARVLTGVGIRVNDRVPRLEPEWQALYRHEGAFEFNPARHDFGSKVLLSKPITGAGFEEVEHAVDLLVAQPACAKLIAHELALYFVSDEPPQRLVDRMAKTFRKSHGDIAEVLAVLFESREFEASLGKKYKDPMHYVISTVRLAYDGRVIVNTRPVLNWLNALGEAPFNRQTPDGYPLTEAGWASSGQIARRFEIARTAGASNAGLFNPEDGSPAASTGFPQLAGPAYYAAVEPYLTTSTRTALGRASSQVEWNTFLLASPEFNYR